MKAPRIVRHAIGRMRRRSQALVYGALIMEAQPMGLAEIVHEYGISVCQAVGALDRLEERGLVQSAWLGDEPNRLRLYQARPRLPLPHSAFSDSHPFKLDFDEDSRK